LKHVTTVFIHADECVEKLLRKARESQDPAMLAIIDRSRKASTILTKASASARCREDICLEAEQK